MIAEQIAEIEPREDRVMFSRGFSFWGDQSEAANRLISVNILNAQPTTMANTIKMTYDGFGRRVGITELHGATTITSNSYSFVWCGAKLCQERDSSGVTVMKRFYALGEQWVTGNNSGNYYFTFDHLGSVREMVDSTGFVRARYDYDGFGRQLKLSGDLDADFGFTGMYVNRTTGLDFTWFRAYDANKGRWLSRDPLGEFIGPNLYCYVWNDSMNWVDLFGLCGSPGNTPQTGNPSTGNGAPVAMTVDPNNLENPISVPGSPNNEWVPGTPSGTGDLNDVWKPKNSLPDQSQPRLSYRPPQGNNPGYYKSSDGLGNNQHFDENGNPIPPDQAHPNIPQGPRPPWWAIPWDVISAMGEALIKIPLFAPTSTFCPINGNSV